MAHKKNTRFHPHCHMFCSLLLRYWESHPSGAHLAGTRFSHRFLCWSHRLLEDCRKQMSLISGAPYQIQISLFRFSRGECQQERESSLKWRCVFVCDLATCRDRVNGCISLSVDEQSTSWCRGMFPLCILWDRQDCYCLSVDTNGVLTYTVYTNSPGGGRAVASVSWISGKERKNTAS